MAVESATVQRLDRARDGELKSSSSFSSGDKCASGNWKTRRGERQTQREDIVVSLNKGRGGERREHRTALGDVVVVVVFVEGIETPTLELQLVVAIVARTPTSVALEWQSCHSPDIN